MADQLTEQVLKTFKLNDDQRTAARERGRDVVVTAGAGSGKTLTLVARYVCFLAEGISPRRIAAITFTKKAAREMRSRVRGKLLDLQKVAVTEEERQKWVDLSSQMDSARIGTIHSLCTEILRAHPAEAGVDPRFEVLDEGLSAALRIQAVDDTLKGLVELEEFLPLLANVSLGNLTSIIQTLLENRLVAGETFARMLDNRNRLAYELAERMNHRDLGGLIQELHGVTDAELRLNAGDTLAEMVRDLLQLWAAAEKAITDRDPVECAAYLFKARREKMSRKSGKGGMVKDTIAALQENYDKLLNPLIGGKNASDSPPSVESEAVFEQLLPLFGKVFEMVNQAYKTLVESRQALDFDDLEYGTQMLLRREDIRSRWQDELDAVLVDEFQDTNQRQREIVEALTGTPGRLFIVGDMRQSIYRFRRADVTVFSKEQDRITRNGGLKIDLNLTYRAHEPLLTATGELLAGVIGIQPDHDRKYYIPYTPLIANDKVPPIGIFSPHVEFVFGVGEDTESARPLAARALAKRLLQLKQEKQIQIWDEVALLFRASTGFPVYEEALEDAGIPFVTVAGRGFYDRPEIRDLMNILRTLADPMDDLSFAGLLRSPAFGLSDAGLFILRQSGLPFWDALQNDLPELSDRDLHSAIRARQILLTLLPMVDKVSVAELLKMAVDAVDYRAVLATADMNAEGRDAKAAGGRLWRNLDKLLEDAQASQQVSLRDFLDMLKTLNDAGAREGEAPAEADGTVRLMTIHKAKGLEFKVVVLADASRQKRASSELIYLSDELGVTFKLDPPPMLYKLAKTVDSDQESCEALRLLYVALTRAKAKLLISGHGKADEDGGIKFSAWLGDLVRVTGIDPMDFIEAEGKPFELLSSSGQPLRAWCVSEDLTFAPLKNTQRDQAEQIASDLAPLYKPLCDDQEAEVAEEAVPFERESWRAISSENEVPGNVLGKIVHKAIQLWLFPDYPALNALLEAEAFNSVIASAEQRQVIVGRAFELLERFRRHPIWNEIDRAIERQTELPYTYKVNGRVENRYIDLLYRNADGWHVVDFKTDPILTDGYKGVLSQNYTRQVSQYRKALFSLLDIDASSHICFLDDQGKVELVEV